MLLSPIGLSLDDLDTPALVLDLDALEFNIDLMARRIREANKAWRPHAKAFKTPAIAHKLIDAGAIGLTVAKVSEAEVFVAAGVNDILIAHLVVGETKCARLAALQRHATVRATVDHADQLPALSASAGAIGVEIGVLVDLDIGLRRTGVRGVDAAVALGRSVTQAPGLRLDGLMGYEGHALYIQDPAEKRAAIESAIDQLARARAAFERASLPCPIVSAAGSGSYEITAGLGCVTELQAGGGIFACPYYVELCRVSGHQTAISVLSTVVSRPEPTICILDAGLKALSNLRSSPVLPKFPKSRNLSISAEHSTFEGPANELPPIGTKLEITPGYSDLTFVLHDRAIATRKGRVEAVWPLWARGQLQ